jgi:hypothetical protein
MKNEQLQPSENLAKHFAPYREEAPLVSAPEIEKLLAGSATLNDHPPTPSLKRSGSLFNTRRIFMTLSGLAGIAAISYLAFFSQGNNGTTATNGPNATQKSYVTHPSHTTSNTTELSQLATPASTSAKHTQLLRQTDNPDGPWSAGNDQFYADLSREELAKLGIATFGDTVRCYNINKMNNQEAWTLTAHSCGGSQGTPPEGMNIPKFFPILATMRNGHSAAFRIEDSTMREWGMIGDNQMEEQFRNWLLSSGTPGYHLMGYTTSSYNTASCKDCPGTEYDTVKIIIVKDLPQPLLWPLQDPIVSAIPNSAIKKIVELGHYYEGTAEKPNFAWPEWPLNLTVKVDTMTVNDLVAEMDSEQNSSSVNHVRSIMARLNDLVPVIVRPRGGSGAPDSNDFIFWYEPSDELFDALPAAQASIIRAKLNEPPHCISMRNEVLKIAEITYCVAEPQDVQVVVRDLTGKILIIMEQLATAGDNVLRFPTETLPSGMYVVTVRDNDSTERSQRLWVENAHPKLSRDVQFDRNSPHAPDQLIFNLTHEPRSAIDREMEKNHPGLLNIPSLELNAESLAKLGIESDEKLAAWYIQDEKPNVVNYVGFMRNGNGIRFNALRNEDVTTVTVANFGPAFVTNGLGFCLGSPSFDTTEAAKAYATIDKLIPILMRENSSRDSITSRDIIFWYKPTPEFLAALPDSERAVAQMMASGTSNSSASVTDIHGAIQQAVSFPNPSKGKFSVQLTLGDARTLTFTLRNLLGQQAAPPVQSRMDGTGEQSLDFSAVPEGVYLLDISSDQGERYIERVVIAH